MTPQDILREFAHVANLVREMNEGIWEDLRFSCRTWTLDDRWELVNKDGITKNGKAVIAYRDAHIECLIEHEIEILFEVALQVPRSWGAAVGVAIEVLQGRGMLNRGALNEFGAECVREITRRGHAPFSRVLVVEEKHETRYFEVPTQETLHAAALVVYNDRWSRGWYDRPIFESAEPNGQAAWKYLQEHSGETDGESISLKKLERA